MEMGKNGDWSLDTKTTTAFALAVALLIAVGVISHRQFASFEENSQWVAHTHEVMTVIEDTNSEVFETQIAMRNYVLTGDDHFAKDYRAGVQTTRQKFQRLRTLTADNPDQQQRLDSLGPLIDTRFGLLEEGIEVWKNQGFQVAVEQLRDKTGNEVVAEISSRFGELKDAEETLLQSRSAELNRDARRSTIALTASVLLAIALIAVAMLLVNRHVAHRESAEADGRRWQLVAGLAENGLGLVGR